jgi:hypothetical protein
MTPVEPTIQQRADKKARAAKSNLKGAFISFS